ncbi:3-methyladenine DNA glycosylase [Microbacterium sp. CH12i]|uniref:3-methyladenine DNA glycosylase n=1 Tax=Microbacterium sp. CH12i TaxID=1479651 RepID=UPI0004611A7E|nr:3-methyladenine DNA glycosylase [Microbacterium sp. CH12i]KDA06245.1 3-methyladenine DNA glycosylase [Microbacterium sp. CH12i]
MSVLITSTLDRSTWQQREAAHHERADALTAAHRGRASRGEKHPVWDFLFTYYSYPPAQLRRWHPGAGVQLEDAAERREWRWYSPGTTPESAVPDAATFASEKTALAGLIERMLRRTAARPGQFGCFGLHEWAMVYRDGEHRHTASLRLGQTGTDAVVEAHDLRCTHFDAFRFFTPDAVGRNRPLDRASQPDLEQPGCLHAGMDVYKWAMKLGPLIPGDLLLDTFELARDIRLLDMEAAPYDLAEWGVVPVAIETAEGKAEYVRRQRGFAERGNVLRQRLLSAWLGQDGQCQDAGAQSAQGAQTALDAASSSRSFMTRSAAS